MSHIVLSYKDVIYYEITVFPFENNCGDILCVRVRPNK